MKNSIKFSLALIMVLTMTEHAFAQSKVPVPVKPAVNKIAAPKTITAQVVKKEETQKQQTYTNDLLNPKNALGVTYAENAITNTYNLIKQNRILEAHKIIEPLSSWLEDATEYHTNLYKVLKDIDTAKVQADAERDLALRFAVLRDKAYYQLALLYIEEKKTQKAVEHLVNVVRSQPKTELGFNSYLVLQQIGFTYKIQLPPEADESSSNQPKAAE